MAEYELDMRGRPCPEPVIETRRLLLTSNARQVVVTVDDQAGADNVCRMAASMGWDAMIEFLEEGRRRVTLAKASSPATEQLPSVPRPSSDAPDAREARGVSARVVVLIASERFGEGDDALGGILMRAFVTTLAELGPLPEALLLVNGGVRLAAEGSPLIEGLRGLAAAGVEVLACGTCLDFYHLKEQLAVGRVTNMSEIVTALTTADRVLRP